MFTDLAQVRTDVEARLTPLLPSTWRFEASVDGAIKSRVPVLYIEFVRVHTAHEGEPLGPGQVLAEFNLIITDPKTDTVKAEADVDANLVPILRTLDGFDDIYWQAADKRRLDDGPLAWAVTTFALVSTATTEE